MRRLKEASILTVGTLTNSLLGLAFYVLVGRNLSVSDFGYFSFLLGLGVLAADLGDLGINAAILKFGHTHFRQIFTIASIQRLAIGGLFIIIALVSQLFYPANFLLSAIIGWILLLTYVGLQSLLVKEQYLLFSFTNIFGNMIRLGIVWFLITGHLLFPETALGSFILGSAVTYLFALGVIFFLEKGIPLASVGLSELLGKVTRFSSWLGLSFGVSALAAKIDGPLVFALAGPVPAGLYSSAQRLSSVFPQLASAIDNVFAPKFSRGENFSRFFKEYLVIAAVVAMLLVLVIPFSGLVITLAFGPKYIAAIPIIQVMLLGFSLFLLTGPLQSSVVYHYGYSKLSAVNSVLLLIVSVTTMLVLIPRFGGMGAALSFVISSLASLIFFGSTFFYLTHHVKDNHAHTS